MSAEPVPEFDWFQLYLGLVQPVQRVAPCFRDHEWFRIGYMPPMFVMAKHSRVFGVRIKYVAAEAEKLFTAVSTNLPLRTVFVDDRVLTMDDFGEDEGIEFVTEITNMTHILRSATMSKRYTVTFRYLMELHNQLPYVSPFHLLGAAVEGIRKQRVQEWE